VCGGHPKSRGLDDLKLNKSSTETNDSSHGRKIAVAGCCLLDLLLKPAGNGGSCASIYSRYLKS